MFWLCSGVLLLCSHRVRRPAYSQTRSRGGHSETNMLGFESCSALGGRIGEQRPIVLETAPQWTQTAIIPIHSTHYEHQFGSNKPKWVQLTLTQLGDKRILGLWHAYNFLVWKEADCGPERWGDPVMGWLRQGMSLELSGEDEHGVLRIWQTVSWVLADSGKRFVIGQGAGDRAQGKWMCLLHTRFWVQSLAPQTKLNQSKPSNN